jgi:hypothetical protein
MQGDWPIDESQARRRDALTRALGGGDLISGLDASAIFNGPTGPDAGADRGGASARSSSRRSPARPRQAAPLRGRASRRLVARAGADWRLRLDRGGAARRP